LSNPNSHSPVQLARHLRKERLLVSVPPVEVEVPFSIARDFSSFFHFWFLFVRVGPAWCRGGVGWFSMPSGWRRDDGPRTKAVVRFFVHLLARLVVLVNIWPVFAVRDFGSMLLVETCFYFFFPQSAAVFFFVLSLSLVKPATSTNVFSCGPKSHLYTPSRPIFLGFFPLSYYFLLQSRQSRSEQVPWPLFLYKLPCAEGSLLVSTEPLIPFSRYCEGSPRFGAILLKIAICSPFARARVCGWISSHRSCGNRGASDTRAPLAPHGDITVPPFFDVRLLPPLFSPSVDIPPPPICFFPPRPSEHDYDHYTLSGASHWAPDCSGTRCWGLNRVEAQKFLLRPPVRFFL